MAKYIYADILREKLIERLGLFEGLSSDTISPIRIDECKKIIGIIDSLQQEPQEVDLEREAVQFCFDEGLNLTTHEAKTIARHFFELGQRKAAEMYDEIEYNRQRAQEQEQPESDLEKELAVYKDYHGDWWGHTPDGRYVGDCFDFSDIEKFAHHIYDLGLNARKEG